MTLVQAGRAPATEPTFAEAAGTLVFRFPRLFAAGERSDVSVESPAGHVEPILWSGSRAYDGRVASFRVKPAEAVRLALGLGPAWGAQALPNFVVGRWYHIATDHVIGQASLGGWYVNGDDGVVVQLEDERVIRFDAFEGDRVADAGTPR
jgi:hypothetical protein